MAIEAPVYVPTDEKFRSSDLITLVDDVRKLFNIDAEKMPLFKVRSPNWFRDHFVVNIETLKYSTFKHRKIRESTYQSVVDGIVAVKTGGVKHRLQEQHFNSVVNRIAAVQHDISDLDYRVYFSATSLNNHGPTRYMENLTGSFMDSVYRRNTKTLPTGYSLNLADERLRNLIPDKIPGVNKSMLYIAEPGTYAPWHIEDVAMMSINYHVAGMPKAWFGMDPDDMFLVNDLVRENYRDCETPLLHRDILTTIEMLEKYNLRYVYTLQQPGEYVITMPMGWHCVANTGCNLSEAVNVYCDGWPVVAGRQNYCLCADRGTTYDSTAWDTVFDWIQVGEQQMIAELADDDVDVEALEPPEDPADFLPNYRARSLTNDLDDDSEASDATQRSRSPVNKTKKRPRSTILSAPSMKRQFASRSIKNTAAACSPDVYDYDDSDKENNLNGNQQVVRPSLPDVQIESDARCEVRLPLKEVQTPIRRCSSRKEKIDKIKKNKAQYVKKEASRKKAHQKHGAKRAQQKKDGKQVVTYERSPVAIHFRNKIRTSRRALRNIDLQVAKYHASVDNDGNELPERLTRERAAHINDEDCLTKRRDLYNVMLKIWGMEKIGGCLKKGHTELTILRDYFNNEDDVNVELFKESMGVVTIMHKEFWEDLLADKEAWKQYFGVDERYRIPHKVWQKLLPMKKQ